MPFQIKCGGCHKEFLAAWSKAIFCSRSCTHRGRFGKQSSRWKGGRARSSHDGYVLFRLPGRYVYEHRYLIEKKLGRSLNPAEHVHHINGRKNDNRLENLIVLTASDHHNHHHPQLYLSRPCAGCKRIIKHPSGEIFPKFCSLTCRNISQRKSVTLECAACHNRFQRVQWRISYYKYKRHFCSTECYKKVAQPPRHWLHKSKNSRPLR